MTRTTAIIGARQESRVFVEEGHTRATKNQAEQARAISDLTLSWLVSHKVSRSVYFKDGFRRSRATKAPASGPALVHEARLFLGGSEATSAAQPDMPALPLLSSASRSRFRLPLLPPRHFLGQKKTEAYS